MEERFKILHGAIGFDPKLGEVYVAIPIPRPIEKKGRWQVVNEVYIVTSGLKMWPITQEEQKTGIHLYKVPHNILLVKNTGVKKG